MKEIIEIEELEKNFNSKTAFLSIRILFLIFFLIIFVILGITISLMKDNPYFTSRYVGSNLAYYNYKSDFLQKDNEGFSLEGITSATPGLLEENGEEEKNYTKSVPVLLYHGILKEPDGKNILLEDFKDQMFTLKQAGWETISVKDFYDFMKEGKKLPERSFLLTFDDSRKDSYYPADGILRALNYTAVMFVITGHSLGNESKGSVFYLSRAELKQMQKTGRWEMQPHTKDGHDLYNNITNGTGDHFYDTKFWIGTEGRFETDEEFRNRILKDFIGAKEDVEKELNESAYTFSYPFNDFGQNNEFFSEVEGIVLDTVSSVYELAFYQVWPAKGFTSNYPNASEFMVKRINVLSSWSGREMLNVLENSRDKEIPYEDDFLENNGWIKAVGTVQIKDGKMQIGSVKNNTVGFVFLDGTYLWQRYTYKVEVEFFSGKSVSLKGGFKDLKNSFSCDFTRGNVWIRRTENDEIVELSYASIKDFPLPEGRFEIGMIVDFDKIGCLLNGKVVTEFYDQDIFDLGGGIGIKIWDEKENNTEIVIDKVSVSLPQESKRVGSPESFEEAEIKIDNNTVMALFSILDEEGAFVDSLDGAIHLVVRDEDDVVLINQKIEEVNYERFFSKNLGRVGFRFSFSLPNDGLGASRDDWVFGKLIYESRDGKQVQSNWMKRQIPSNLLDRTQRYLARAITVNKSIRQGDFEFIIVRVGEFIPQTRLQDNVTLYGGRSPNMGASRGVEHYRIDLIVKNLGRSGRLNFEEGGLKDNLGNEYEIRYESNVDMLDGHYPEYTFKEGFILFYMPSNESSSVEFLYKSGGEYFHPVFLFKGLPVVS